MPNAAFMEQLKVKPSGRGLEARRLPYGDRARLLIVVVITMPRPYPTFLPYYFLNNSNTALKLEDIEGLQISIHQGLPEAKLTGSHEGFVGW